MSHVKRVAVAAVVVAAASVGCAGVANASDLASTSGTATVDGVNAGGLIGDVLDLIRTLL